MKHGLMFPAAAAGTFLCLLPGCSQEERAPNVVFILADDLGWAQTSAYVSGYYHTPHIDRLAREGVRFTDAYSAAAICSPTRASIMTGKYPARLHLTDFIPGADLKGTLLRQPDWQMFLPLEEVTIAEIFRGKGYRTAMFGKWHLSKTKFGPESLPHYPDKQGFDDFFVIDKPESTDNPEEDPHKSDSIGNTSVRFIHENTKKPFFLYASFSAIHNPLMDSADSITKWQNTPGAELPENNPVIAAMLSRMDNNIGKILKALDETGLAENTLVVFFSDNGGLEKEAAQTPLRSGKGWLYEGGIRVPLVVRWPGRIREGQVSHEVVSSIDFLPTFCGILGVKPPDQVDGISLLPLLLRDEPLPQRDVGWHYPHYHTGSGMPPGGALRSGNWKLIEYYEKSMAGDSVNAFELFDLKADMGEQQNLFTTHPEKAGELMARMHAWREQVGAQMPVLNPDLKQ